MTDVLANAKVIIILQCINLSNQHVTNLDLHNFICQLYLNKARKNQTSKRAKQHTTTSCLPPPLPLDIKICSEKEKD